MGSIKLVCIYLLKNCFASHINRAIKHFATLSATCKLDRVPVLDFPCAHQSVDTDRKPSSETRFTANTPGGSHCSPIYGGPGGTFFNDGMYSGIRRITVTVNQGTLTSLQLDYGLEGDINVKDRYFRGVRHGGAHGSTIVYELNYPGEIVTKISGFNVTHFSWVVIKSLTFHTNQRKLGPCGSEQGVYFETNKEKGKIIGIHGSGSTGFVYSIGVYMLNL